MGVLAGRELKQSGGQLRLQIYWLQSLQIIVLARSLP